MFYIQNLIDLSSLCLEKYMIYVRYKIQGAPLSGVEHSLLNVGILHPIGVHGTTGRTNSLIDGLALLSLRVFV